MNNPNTIDFWNNRLSSAHKRPCHKHKFPSYWDDPNRFSVISKLVKGKVLDVGCALGGLCMWIASEGHDVTGIDYAPKAIEIAKKGAKDYSLDIKYHVMDGKDINLNREFDTVIFAEILEHYDNPLSLLAEGLRVLKDDGIMIITLPNPAITKWNHPTHLVYYTLIESIQLLSRLSDDITVIWGEEQEHFILMIKPRPVRYSICTTNYNMEQSIDYFLDSIINQMDEHVELVIVDDGSTDNSRNIIDFYYEKAKDMGTHIERIYLEPIHNRGITRKIAGMNALGEWLIHSFDCDQTYNNNALQRIKNLSKELGNKASAKRGYFLIPRKLYYKYPHIDLHWGEDLEVYKRLKADGLMEYVDLPVVKKFITVNKNINRSVVYRDAIRTGRENELSGLPKDVKEEGIRLFKEGNYKRLHISK
jgi:2-polyprenyl-3-methyl-5-hydroxy-6-metoxy-1,4-benzoquinol methylase